jgi:hypothetical protein
MNGYGGARRGAERKPGGRNKATIERELRVVHGVEAAVNGGLMPLDVMLCRMRGQPLPNGRLPTDEQFEAAKAAAPYLHPRVMSTQRRGRHVRWPAGLADGPRATARHAIPFNGTTAVLPTLTK